MATVSSEAKAAARAEAEAAERARRYKEAREDWVRVQVRNAQKELFSKIVVSNVYGDNFRVNYYAETAASDSGMIRTHRIVRSEFIKMTVPTTPVN